MTAAPLCDHCPLRAPTQPLTDRQAELLRFLGDYHRRRGTSPPYARIAQELGVRSLSSVYSAITMLEEKGWITRKYATRQSIELTAPAVVWLREHSEERK